MLRLIAVVLLCAAAAGAYNPPVDTAGPLTVRMQEPAAGAYGAGGLVALTAPGTPMMVPVMIENASEGEIRGEVRVEVIDLWAASPSGPVPFIAPPKGRTRLDFQVSFGEGTHNAVYPVHAFASFEHGGKRLTAHPILLLTPRMPNPPRARVEAEWKPAPVDAPGGVALWRLRAHRESVRVEEEAPPPTAPRETYEISPSVVYGARVERGTAREAVTMTLGLRPPSLRERVTAAAAEFPLELPKTQPLALFFATAVSENLSGQPPMFRVRVLPFEETGPVQSTFVFQQRVASSSWLPARADLSQFAGKRVRLVLEVESGKADATGQCHWGEPVVVAGPLPEARPFPPATEAGSLVVGAIDGTEVRLWPGRRGLLDAVLGFRDKERRLFINGFRVRVLGDWLDDWRSAIRLLEVREESPGGRYGLRHRFESWAGAFDLASEVWIEKGVLRVRFRLDSTPPPRPWVQARLEEVKAGPWSQALERVFAGTGNVIVKPQAFQLGFDGHRLATSFAVLEFANGSTVLMGVDSPPDRLEVVPEGRLFTLSTPGTQTITFIPSADVWTAVKAWRAAGDYKPGAGVARLAGRFVFDLWRGDYGESARALRSAFRYGLTNSVVVWHGWQRWGYDYRLPDIYPPNPQFGSFSEFTGLLQASKEHGVYFAPHDNYIDYYPDSEGFSYGNIAFEPNGQPRRAWFNYGRQAQSYRARADKIRPFLERNVKLIKEGFAPNSYFIDVWSSMGPYDYWTDDGRFIDRTATRQVWRESFAWIWDYLGDAPQISEAGHDQLIGWLDGSQAQMLRVDPTPGRNFVWAVRSADAERIPIWDAAYHDIFILHGAGYPGRYSGGLEESSHGIYSDDYIATEVLTGHPAMVAHAFNRSVVRKYWLLDAMMRGLALRRIDQVRFADGDIHRQEVRWDNGAEVYVNRGGSDWNVNGRVLPQYGFYARIPAGSGTVEAAIESRNGHRLEWARSAESWYFNTRVTARQEEMSLWAVTTNGAFRLEKGEREWRLTPLPESGRFQVRLRWNDIAGTGKPPTRWEAVSEEGTRVGEGAVMAQSGMVTLQCEPGVFQYRLR